MLELIILLCLAVWLALAVRKLHRDKKSGICTGCGECSRCGGCADAESIRHEKSPDESKMRNEAPDERI